MPVDLLAWISRLVNRDRNRAKARKKQLGVKNKTIKKLIRIIDRFMVPAVHKKATKQIEVLLTELNDQEVRKLNKVTVMGFSRLFLEKQMIKPASSLLSRYIHVSRIDQLLYFLEPLVELYRSGAFRGEPLGNFCASFQSPFSVNALDLLNREYKPVNEPDRRNFQSFIIEPLCALAENEKNLMDIRFSPSQRSDLLSVIKTSVSEERPLSLLRLGDGEAYPYPAPRVEGIEQFVFENDDINFERSRTHWGVSPPPGNAREDLITRFRQAVAQCDILGIPSVYRIIRNMVHPYSNYGTRRNQRAFMRILNALGKDIPIEQKFFTEERCTRIRGAIDEAFLVDLATIDRSVLLVSCWPNIQSKFPVKSSLILVPASGKELFKIYPEIVERVRAASRPGTIVLVGAGVPAKIMVHEARQSGAVALDVGSLLDYMVEQKTRTIADLI